jgi:hypothetical protein
MEVKDFLVHVPNANEESITDFLLWKWRLLDKRFNYINVATHSHLQESTTSGADFEMELWFVGRTFSMPLLFQAKKLVKPFDGYRRRLCYPNGTQKQLRLLLAHARLTGRNPFYALYAVPDHTGVPDCNCAGSPDSGVFVVDARAIMGFANGKHGKKVSKGALLSAGRPFHCWFCCPSFLVDYLNGSVKFFAPGIRGARSTRDLPAYAQDLLGTEQGFTSAGFEAIRHLHGLLVRRVGVYDVREEESPTLA